MYLTGQLSIDPTQMTHVEIKKPTKAFAKLLHVMTAGLASEKEELETFTAVSIMQQFNQVFRAMGVNNIVRLAKDDIDFFFDEKGEKDDLKAAMEQFRLETDRYESELFDTLYLVVEHEDSWFKYLIEVDIKRRHKVSEDPIVVKINGLLRDFDQGGGAEEDEMRTKMQATFSNQESYDGFVQGREAAFKKFCGDLEQNIRKFIKVDKVASKTTQNITRPKSPVKDRKQVPHGRGYDQPVYHGYPGFGEMFFYAWIWSSMMHTNHIHVHNADIVDDQGQAMMSVGDEGFDAGATDTMNPEADFSAPEGGDVEFHQGHDFESEFQSAGLGAPEAAGDVVGGESGGWLEGLRGGDGGGGDAGRSSCGGGCGGGCGGA